MSFSNEELLEKFRSTDSPIDRTLNLQFEAIDQDLGTCTLSFRIGSEYTGPMGAVFGGIQSTMLDAALSIAGTVKTGHTMGMVSIEIKTSYLKQAGPGKFVAKGRSVRVGRKVAFLESELFDQDGTMVARACGTALPVPFQ